jgi:hypothetical protein
MITIRDYLNKCKTVASKILDEQERIVLANETKIINLNINAFQEGKGSNDKKLNNINDKVKGVYSLATQLINPEKIAGTLYTFQDTNVFINNFQIQFQSNLTKFDIFSTGTGSGDKSIFFAGYTNLFGLDKNNSNIVNYEIVYPDLMKFIKQTL